MLAPFPWFGGKSRVSPIIWHALGQASVFIAPFTGSAAEWLACPPQLRDGVRRVVLNDLDCHVANFWRAARDHPSVLAAHCAGPLTEADQLARHRWLCTPANRDELARRICDDPAWSDPRAAAWWAAGLSGWIGGSWCAGEFHGADDARTRGTGLRRGKLPHMTSGNGVYAQRVQADIPGYFAALAERLARVTVLCGDWSRAVGRWTDHVARSSSSAIGVVLDPPYAAEADRCDVYRCEDSTVSHAVRRWAIETSARQPSRWRMVLCGYDGEHDQDELTSAGWSTIAWSAQGGYSNRGGAASPSRGKANRHRERLWLSPGCSVPTQDELDELLAGSRVIEHAGSPRSTPARGCRSTSRPTPGRASNRSSRGAR